MEVPRERVAGVVRPGGTGGPGDGGPDGDGRAGEVVLGPPDDDTRVFRFNPLEEGEDTDVDVSALVREFNLFDAATDRGQLFPGPSMSRFVAFDVEGEPKVRHCPVSPSSCTPSFACGE